MGATWRRGKKGGGGEGGGSGPVLFEMRLCLVSFFSWGGGPCVCVCVFSVFLGWGGLLASLGGFGLPWVVDFWSAGFFGDVFACRMFEKTKPTVQAYPIVGGGSGI